MKKINLFVFLSITIAILAISACKSKVSQDGDKNIVDGANVECYNEAVLSLNGKCKYIKVKASPNDLNDNRYINIYYAVIKAKGVKDIKEPIVLLTDTPTASMSGKFSKLFSQTSAHSDLLREHDYILVDYRGAGYSKPFASCDDVDFYDSDKFVNTLNKCSNSINSNIKLTDYSTYNIASDVNEILRRENVDKASLFGISYGTRVAMSIATNFPQRVSKIIVDGLIPPEVNMLSQAKEAILEKLSVIRDRYNKAYANKDFNKELEKYLSRVKNKTANLIEFSKLAYSVDIETDLNDEFDRVNISNGVDTSAKVSKILNQSNPQSMYDQSPLMAFSIIYAEEASYLNTKTINTYNFSKNVVDALNDYSASISVPISSIEKLKLKGVKKAPPSEIQSAYTNIATLILTAGQNPNEAISWSVDAQRNLPNSKNFFFKKESWGLSMSNRGSYELISKFLNVSDVNLLDSYTSKDSVLLK